MRPWPIVPYVVEDDVIERDRDLSVADVNRINGLVARLGEVYEQEGHEFLVVTRYRRLHPVVAVDVHTDRSSQAPPLEWRPALFRKVMRWPSVKRSRRSRRAN